MPTKTDGPEAPGDANADSYAQGFPLQELDIFDGSGTRGQEVDLDEEALAKKADDDAKAAKAAKKKAKKKKGFGF